MGERGTPDRLRDLLPEVAARFGLKDPAGAGLVWGRWSEIVGEHIAAHAEPTSLRESVLRVRTDSPAWATEIGYLARDIIERVNDAAGKQLVRELKVWTGPGSMRRGSDAPNLAGARGDADAPTEEPVPEDPEVALEAARAAWERARKDPSGRLERASGRGSSTGRKRR